MIDKKLVKSVEGSMKYVVLNIITQWVSLILNIIIIFIIGDVLNQVLIDSIILDDIMLKAFFIFILIALRFILSLVASHYSYNASKDVKHTLRSLIYHKLLLLGPAYNEDVSTSEVVQVEVEGVDQLEIYFGKYMPQFFYSLLAPLTLFIVLAPMDLPSALTLLLCVPLIPISIIAVQKFAKKLLAKYWGQYTTLGDSFLENLEGLTTLKIYSADGIKNEQMNLEAENFRKITMRVLIMQLNSISVMDMVAFGGAALGIIVAIYRFMNHDITFVQTFAFIMLASEFFIPLRLLGSFFHIAMNGMAASDKIFQLLDIETHTQGTLDFNEDIERIDINDLTFSYLENKEVLKNNTYTFKKGITAIVGESGCGKSTLAKIISAQLNNYSGSIKLNDHEFKDIKTSHILSKITLVPHDPYLFKGSIKENLIQGNNTITDLEIQDAIKLMKIDTFLDTNKGLDTLISENASNLSGGQRQRIAMARALLKKSDVYIFDEATANIDSESENYIMQAIEVLSKEKIIILISHRLANVVNANTIYTLDDGHIVEHANHDELMKLKGKYETLFSYQKQLENYSLKGDSHV